MMIVLVGFMGSGKSVVGPLIAGARRATFVDTDEVIAAQTGSSIAEIFATQGEAGFRSLERDVVLKTLAENDRVVALGGGAVTDADVRAALRDHDVVYLRVDADEALHRIGNTSGRPLLGSKDPAALLAEREPLYREVAKVVVDTSGKAPEEVARAIDSRLAMRLVEVSAGGDSYEVAVGSDIAGEVEAVLPGLPDAEKAIVVTHPGLAPLATDLLATLAGRGFETHVVTIPEGEASKTSAVAAGLHEELARIPVHRHDLVVTFGGGVVCDVGGFAASTFMRGVPLLHVPTTLLAQVDAAIGGKTGINLDLGKNLVGTFYQPVAVVCDVNILRSCPPAEMRSGIAEVVKYGLIAEPELLDLVEARADSIVGFDTELLIDVVARCVSIKASIVASDETEQAERAHLNYGHTFAHAIEAASGYGGIRHGEAVSLGMMLAAHSSRLLDRIDDAAVARHRRPLQAAGLPTSARLDLATLEEAWKRDKKYRKGVKFVLLMEIGKPEAGVEVPLDVVEGALERLAEGGTGR